MDTYSYRGRRVQNTRKRQHLAVQRQAQKQSPSLDSQRGHCLLATRGLEPVQYLHCTHSCHIAPLSPEEELTMITRARAASGSGSSTNNDKPMSKKRGATKDARNVRDTKKKAKSSPDDKKKYTQADMDKLISYYTCPTNNELIIDPVTTEKGIL